MLKAIIFDMDGVLVDSFFAHINYCNELIDAYRLSLPKLNVEDFKNNVIKKKKIISPMIEFFKAAGFPEDIAKKADEQYVNNFYEKQNNYIKPYDKIINLLMILKESGIKLGLVTSNRKYIYSNILGGLNLFEDGCVKCFNGDLNNWSKPISILEIVNILKLDLKEVIYVGDQSTDYLAAKEANISFIGVTWGFICV